MGLLLIASLSLGGLVLWTRIRRSRYGADATWGCGYLAPKSSMQYTSSSFAQMLVGLFGWVLRPRSHWTNDLPMFPRRAEFHSDVPDAVLDVVVLPTFRYVGVAFLVVPGVAARKRPDLFAVCLPRLDRVIALALGEMR